MTVKECIAAAAVELGIGDEVRDCLDGVSSTASGDVKNLLQCFNLVENELALDYLPLLAEDTLETDTGTVCYSELSRAVVRVIGVRDQAGNDVAYQLFPDFLKAQAGTLTVRYSYTPTPKTLSGKSDYTLYASVRLFAYGMAAEYAAATGQYEAAAVWDKKYKAAITAAYRTNKAKKIRARRWV